MEKLSPVAQQYVTNSQGTMDTVTVQTAPQVVQPTVSTVQKPDTFVNSSSIQQTKQIDKKKVIIGVGIAVAAVAAVAAIVHGAKTGKIGKSKETTQKAIEEVKKEVKKEATSEKTKEVVKGLKDIKFDKGVASLKDSGEKFTGKLAHTYKNGDKVVLEYADGILKKSTGEGTKSFEKVYQTVNGEKLVCKTVNGKAETVNITKIQNEVKLAQEKLKSLLANKDISAEDFEKQASEIKYKSKPQLEEISKTTQAKQKAEAELKAKLEEETKKAQEAAKKAEEEVKIAAENASNEENSVPEISKIRHDISGGQDSYDYTFIRKSSNEEITLVLPKNPMEEDNGNIYKDLKLRYGEGRRNSMLRAFNGTDEIADINSFMDECQKDVCSFIDYLIDGTPCNRHAANSAFDFLDPIISKDKTLTRSSRSAISEAIWAGDSSVFNKLDKEAKEEAIKYLKGIKSNFAEKYKEFLLNDVNEIYSRIEKNVSPLKNTHHLYRGIQAKCVGDNPYLKFLSKFKIGETVTPDYGAMFVTRTPEYALKYTTKDGVLLHFIMPKGAKISSGFMNEDLLPPMAKFKVLGSKQIGKEGFRVIDLEYLIDQGTRSL